MRILVTGGSGYLGKHIRKFFNADDLSRRSNLDILNLQDAQIVSEYDVVIHMAAYLDKSPDNAEQGFLTNVEGTINLLRNMQPNSVFIFASTKDVYGKHADNFDEVPEHCLTDFCGQSPLEWSKLIAEKYVQYYSVQNNFRSCILRLSTVYAPQSEGNEPNFVGGYMEAIAHGDTLKLPGKGKPRRDLLHVSDLALACRSFIDSEVMHGLYNLGGGLANSTALDALVKQMGNVCGKKPVIDSSSNIPAPAPFNYVSDISKIEHELGWKPTISIEQGLRKIIKGE